MNEENKMEQQPEGSEKLFTQEDVNRIVSERLARERAKAEPTPEAIREQNLTARESRMACHEYLVYNGQPLDFLDVLDTSNPEKFKSNVEKLTKLMSIAPAPEIRSAGLSLSEKEYEALQGAKEHKLIWDIFGLRARK